MSEIGLLFAIIFGVTALGFLLLVAYFMIFGD